MNEKNPFSIYSKANLLLNRPTDEQYIQEWTDLISHERVESSGENYLSVVIFRLGKEWLALSTGVFSEVTENKLIRRIPHREGEVLRGLVNLRGQLCLCVDLSKLLEIESYTDPSKKRTSQMIAIEQNQQRWVFIADEILGIFLCDMDTLKNIPVTVAKSTANYLKGTVTIEGKQVSVLDEELLFYSLERRMV